ncbi:hypothetical protein AC1_0609 [Clostridium perfringens B str. ATCC 3626]|uniref:Uncharacterized protein n=1 Tax=Clostridium perfringens B str. ATCC 3626 TaxID=451754 RepID=A0AAV3BS89_CLOPF|nr:hypothetical protein AC1_0609 [Clostridium perfringens B str. ATCC 3626]
MLFVFLTFIDFFIVFLIKEFMKYLLKIVLVVEKIKSLV